MFTRFCMASYATLRVKYMTFCSLLAVGVFVLDPRINFVSPILRQMIIDVVVSLTQFSKKIIPLTNSKSVTLNRR